MIRRIARWLRLVKPEDEKRHIEAERVLSAAHREIDESRRRRRELATRLGAVKAGHGQPPR